MQINIIQDMHTHSKILGFIVDPKLIPSSTEWSKHEEALLSKYQAVTTPILYGHILHPQQTLQTTNYTHYITAHCNRLNT